MRSGDAGSLRFGPTDVLRRVERRGDLFGAALALRQTLAGPRLPARRRGRVGALVSGEGEGVRIAATPPAGGSRRHGGGNDPGGG